MHLTHGFAFDDADFMFRFEHPYYLYALELIPLLGVFFYFMQQARRRARQRFGNAALVQQLMPQASRYKHATKFWLLMLGLIFLIVGWANPQWGTKRETIKRKGIDVFIALDVSNSMLAEDIAPSRLERAKKFAEDLVEKLRGERIGFILFAGNAYLQVPLTIDYAALNIFIKSAHPDLMPTQGTSISAAIAQADRWFPMENKRHKVLVIISDGESHEEGALAKAEEARKNGLLIFTIGAGTSEGGFIPDYSLGRFDFKRNERNEPVRTRLDETTLRQVAAKGEGAYFNLTADTEPVLKALEQRIQVLEKQEFEQRAFSEFESYFQYFLGLALLILVIEFLMSYSKNRYLADKDLFRIQE